MANRADFQTVRDWPGLQKLIADWANFFTKFRKDSMGWFHFDAPLVTTGRSSAVATKAGSYTLTATDEVIFASGTLYLPSAAANPGRRFSIKADADISVFPQAGDNVEGDAVLAMAKGVGLELVSDGLKRWALMPYVQAATSLDDSELLRKLLDETRAQRLGLQLLLGDTVPQDYSKLDLLAEAQALRDDEET